MKAFQTGVRHAYLAQGVKRAAESVLESFQKKKTMAPIAKYGSKKTGFKKSVSKTNVKKTRSVVKDTILRMATTFHNVQNDNTLQVTALLQNTIYTNNLTAQLQTGVFNESRQGDACYLVGLNVKGNFFSTAEANAYQYRVMILMSGEEYDFGSGFGIGLLSSQIFLPTGTGVGTSAIVNPKAVTVLHDEIIDINSQVGGARDVCSTQFYVPLNRKFQYQSDASEYGKTKNLYMVIRGFKYGGVSGTTDIGNCSFNTDLIFKNL